MEQNKLRLVLEKHELWLAGDEAGERANLTRANLTGANLTVVDLSRANLTRANLTEANLSRADLTGANLSWVDLTGANLTVVDLSRANLTRANLTEANLSWADLTEANLSWVDLTRVNLFEANLSWVDLSRANLTRANLTGANLTGANLTEANLGGVGLTEANLSRANLTWANLSEANGLFDGLAYVASAFEATVDGLIVYKFEAKAPQYQPNPDWKFEPGAVLSEVVNPYPTLDCACGVNVATREWCEKAYANASGRLWKCIVRWPWAVGVVVPYNTDGKIRCARVELIEVVKEQ